MPIYCIFASWISFYLTVYIGGFFFTVKTVDADGITSISVDPVRSAIFNGVLFAAVLLIGGLWVFRSQSKREIFYSACITSAFYLALTICQMLIDGFPISVSANLAMIQNWTGTASSFLLKLTDWMNFSLVLGNFSPFLLLLFGSKANQDI